jgi:hypothetical protein
LAVLENRICLNSKIPFVASYLAPLASGRCRAASSEDLLLVHCAAARAEFAAALFWLALEKIGFVKIQKIVFVLRSTW